MKVLFLNAYGNGSTGRIVNGLENVCASHGIDTLAIYSREQSIYAKDIKVTTKFEFYLDGILTRILDFHGLSNLINTKKILNIVSSFSPDIVHIHNLHGYWINYSVLCRYLKIKGIKVVWTFHDCWNFTGHCTHFDYLNCNKWKTGCYSCPQKDEYPRTFFIDGSKRNYHKKKQAFSGLKNAVVVTPSKWLASKASESFMAQYPIKVINNGIDLTKFHYMDSDKRLILDKYGCSKLSLCVATTWNKRKGLDYIFEVSQILSNWLFVIIGDATLYSSQRVPANMLFIDKTESIKVLAEWYSAADVFVNPTLEDTYPTTNLEAIACRTPVLTFPTGGSPEIVEATGCGYVLRERNARAIIEGLNIIENMRFSEQQFSDAILRIDQQLRFLEYLEIYNSLVFEGTVKDGN